MPKSTRLEADPGASRARHALYCFPYLGGSSRYAEQWRDALEPRVEIVPVSMPGRGGRWSEAPPDSVFEVARESAGMIASRGPAPVLFGHSMGGLLAFETVRELERCGVRVAALVVTGTPAPDEPLGRWLDRDVSDDLPAFLDVNGPRHLRRLADPSLLTALTPVVTADLRMLSSYRYTRTQRLTCPILAFAGERDPIARPESVAGWALHTASHFRFSVHPGDHFFIEDAGREIFSAVSRLMAT